MRRISRRKKKQRLEDLPIPSDGQIQFLSVTLAKQIESELFRKKYAGAAEILKLAGAGVFLAASITFPNLPKALSPYLVEPSAYEVWKRFNVPYLKRTLSRLEREKLVEIGEEEGIQVVKITASGKRRILKYALDELAVKKPKLWDKTWRLVSYDLPKNYGNLRDIFREYLRAWGFYPLHKSVFLHAYPCGREVDFLREYLGIGEYVRIFKVSAIENDRVFREFFGV